MANIPYSEKLKDPRWQKKRLEIMNRDKWTCQKCGDDETTLNVHHRIYLSNTDPWDYPGELLITLCENCHQYEMQAWPIVSDNLIILLKKYFFAENIQTICEGLEKFQLKHVPEVVASAYQEAFALPEVQITLIEGMFKRTRDRLQNHEREKGNG